LKILSAYKSAKQLSIVNSNNNKDNNKKKKSSNNNNKFARIHSTMADISNWLTILFTMPTS